MSKIDKDVIVYDTKREKSKIIKIVREFSKGFGLNQFDTALQLLLQFFQLTSTFDKFVRDIGKIDEFVNYLKSLNPQFFILLENFLVFAKKYSERLVREF